MSTNPLNFTTEKLFKKVAKAIKELRNDLITFFQTLKTDHFF
jgi:hypothetical protein